MKFSIGDVVTVSPLVAGTSNGGGLEFAVITEIDSLTLTVVQLSEELSDATELDPIVSTSVYGFGTDFAVITLAEATIHFDQVCETLSRLDLAIRDEIVNCRYGQPSDIFQHGLWLLPAPFDKRHEPLTRKIQAFADWHSVNRDLVYCSPDELHLLALGVDASKPHESPGMAERQRDFLMWCKARDAATSRVESEVERRRLKSEIQQGSESAILLIAR